MLGAILAELRNYTCNLRMGFHDNGKDCEPHSVLWFVEKLLCARQMASCNNKEVLVGRRCNVRVTAGVKDASVLCGRIVESQRLGSQRQHTTEHTENLPAQPEVHTRPDLRPS